MAVEMLNDAYQITLEEIHRWYPVRTGQPIVAAVPLRKLQEIMSKKGWPQSRFLAVNGVLMNPDHRPVDAFEKQAVRELTAGADRTEAISAGRLRVTKAISLQGGCRSCHWVPGREETKAALSFSVPLK